MDTKQPKLSPFRFINFKVVESSIRHSVTSSLEQNLNYNISPSGTIDEEKKLFQIKLVVEINDDNQQFQAKVVIVGLFEFKSVVSIEHLDNYFYTNAPAIIFPYVRSYIAALTALSGFGTINLPPINVGNLKDELIAQTNTGEL